MTAHSRGFLLVAEEPEFLVLNKEAGIDFHDCQGRPGLCSLVREWFKQPVFAVHRLDKATSGLLLMATSRSMAARLAMLFRDHAVRKYYVALSDLSPHKKQGLLIGDMVRSRRGSWKLCRTREHPARTQFLSFSVRPGLRLFVLKPLTGRTHQLRVAMKSLGAPILGDNLYHQCAAPWPDRMYLHAQSVHFMLEGQSFAYTSPPTVGTYFEEVRPIMETLGSLDTLPWPAKKTPTPPNL